MPRKRGPLPQPIWISDPTQPAGKALNPNAFTLPLNGVYVQG